LRADKPSGPNAREEPSVGLDPQTREHIWNYLDQLRANTGTTIFLTTH